MIRLLEIKLMDPYLDNRILLATCRLVSRPHSTIKPVDYRGYTE